MRSHFSIALLILLALPGPVHAQEPADEPAAAPGPASLCEAPEYRQFDFWLGDWDVSSNGVPAGRNRVESVQGGCVLQENWKGSGVGGITGTSLNIYDRESGRWHQTWVDASGTLLQLDGGLVDGAMVLEGERQSPAGGVARHRITWTPDADGSVHQLWEASQDDGKTWNVIFDGRYTKADRFR